MDKTYVVGGRSEERTGSATFLAVQSAREERIGVGHTFDEVVALPCLLAEVNEHPGDRRAEVQPAGAMCSGKHSVRTYQSSGAGEEPVALTVVGEDQSHIRVLLP